jgi:hypothetical protein
LGLGNGPSAQQADRPDHHSQVRPRGRQANLKVSSYSCQGDGPNCPAVTPSSCPTPTSWSRLLHFCFSLARQ